MFPESISVIKAVKVAVNFKYCFCSKIELQGVSQHSTNTVVIWKFTLQQCSVNLIRWFIGDWYLSWMKFHRPLYISVCFRSKREAERRNLFFAVCRRKMCLRILHERSFFFVCFLGNQRIISAFLEESCVCGAATMLKNCKDKLWHWYRFLSLVFMHHLGLKLQFSCNI